MQSLYLACVLQGESIAEYNLKSYIRLPRYKKKRRHISRKRKTYTNLKEHAGGLGARVSRRKKAYVKVRPYLKEFLPAEANLIFFLLLWKEQCLNVLIFAFCPFICTQLTILYVLLRRFFCKVRKAD